ncbi:DUF11 domain-containing protein [Deinococcus piscis]|nr:DUF11 domain-containing protein [Deinococcus piscis]
MTTGDTSSFASYGFNGSELNSAAVDPQTGQVYWLDRGGNYGTYARSNQFAIVWKYDPFTGTKTNLGYLNAGMSGNEFIGAVIANGSMIVTWGNYTYASISLATLNSGVSTTSHAVTRTPYSIPQVKQTSTNGDIAVDNLGKVWLLYQDATGTPYLGEFNPVTATVSNSRAVTGLGGSASLANGLSYDSAYDVFQVSDGSSIWTISRSTFAAVRGNAVSSGLTDLASCGTPTLVPQISKAFDRTAVQIDAVTGRAVARLTVTVQNGNRAPIMLFQNTVDALPAGSSGGQMAVSSTPNYQAVCVDSSGFTIPNNSGYNSLSYQATSGGSVQAQPPGPAASATSWSLPANTIIPSGTCTFSFDVSVTQAGIYNNVIAAGAQSSAGTDSDGAQASLNALAAQSIQANPTTYPATCDQIRWANTGISGTALSGTRTFNSLGGISLSAQLTSATGSANGIFGYSTSFANDGSWNEVRAVSSSLATDNSVFLTRAGGGTSRNTVTLTFPYPVINVRFGITDLDARSGTATTGDWLQTTAAYGGTTFVPDMLIAGGTSMPIQAYVGGPTGTAGVPTTLPVPGRGNSAMGAAAQPNTYSALMGVDTTTVKNADGTNRQGQGVAYFRGPLTTLTIETGSLKGAAGQAIAFGDISFCAPQINLKKSAGTPQLQPDGSFDIPYTLTYTNATYDSGLYPDATVRETPFAPSIPTPSGLDAWARLRPQITDSVVTQMINDPNIKTASIKTKPVIAGQVNTVNLDSSDLNASFDGAANAQLISANTDGRVDAREPDVSQAGTFQTSFTVNVVPESAAPSTFQVSNTAQATGYLNTSTPLSSTASAASSISPAALLSVRKEVNTPYVVYGRSGAAIAPNVTELTYTLTVSNQSSKVAEQVVATDTLPPGTTFVSSTLAPSTNSGNVLTWNLGNLAAAGQAGSSRSFTVTVRVPSSSFVEANQSTPFQLLNSLAAQGTNTLEGKATALTKVVYPRLDKVVRNVTRGTAFASSVDGYPGEQLEYCIDFRSYGTEPLTNFKVEDRVPGNTSYVPGSLRVSGVTATLDDTTAVLRASVGTLNPGGAGRFCFRARVN